MKKIKSIAFFALMVASLSFVACDGDIEPIDPAIDTSANTGGTSTGEYWPRALNNQWDLEQNGVAISPYKIIGTDNFNGSTYYKFAPMQGFSGSGVLGEATTWINKNGGTYKIKMSDINLNFGGITGTQTGYEMVILKDNIPVNGTWNSQYTQTTTYTGVPAISQVTSYTGTVLEKDATETVHGETFNNVIKVKIVFATTLSGTTSSYTSEYWFAKDVGPIKSITTSQSGSSETVTVDYILN